MEPWDDAGGEKGGGGIGTSAEVDGMGERWTDDTSAGRGPLAVVSSVDELPPSWFTFPRYMWKYCFNFNIKCKFLHTIFFKVDF